MLLDLEIRSSPFENAVAELVGCGIAMATLQLSPAVTYSQGWWQHRCSSAYPLSGGCDFFNCWESCTGRLNVRTLLLILFEANNGRSALSISIDPREEDSDKEYNPDEPNLSPVTVKVVWFDPSQDADQEIQDDYCEMSLHVGEVAGENELLKYDESEYLLMVGISPAGFDSLLSKLKEISSEDNRPYAEIKVIPLINDSSLGFLSCRQGWVHKEEGGIEVNGGRRILGYAWGYMILFSLCECIFTAEEVRAYKIFFHI